MRPTHRASDYDFDVISSPATPSRPEQAEPSARAGDPAPAHGDARPAEPRPSDRP